MKPPAFIKVQSRLGLQNVPFGQNEANIGVEHGPDAVLSATFLQLFPNSTATTYQFPKPEEVDEKLFYPTLAQAASECRGLINKSMKPNETQVVVGGDHSVTFPSVLAVLERIKDPTQIGYIQFDSHGDILLERESTTKNFHGMYVRALVDRFDIAEIEALVPSKIPVENLLYIGNLDLEPPEQKFFRNRGIKNITKKDLEEANTWSFGFFERFINRFKHLHVSFDIDGLDRSIAPATGIPARDGLKMQHIRVLLERLQTRPSLSVDIVEVNPARPGADQTIHIAQEVISLLLGT